MSTKCVSVCVVYSGVDLLQHYLKHYDRIGVNEMMICAGVKAAHDMLKGEPEDRKQNELPRIIEACRRYRTKVYPFQYDYYKTVEKLCVERNALAHYGIGEDEYVMWTDLDEFFSFPAPLHEILDEMDRHDDWAIHGQILDRVAADGSLPEIRNDLPIEEQFPIGCNITGRFLNANTRKIMVARGCVRVNEGHDTAENVKIDRVPVGVIQDYTAHHFRWSRALTEKIVERLQNPQGLNPVYVRECNKLLSNWNQNQRIDLSNPIFAAHPAKPIRYFQ